VEVEASPGEVTVLLAELKRGDKDALGKLVPLVYGELRRLAGHYMRAERVGHTLQPTAVVHEAYLRLVGEDWAEWQNRAQFVGVAARQMRRILVDYARQHVAAKRGGTPVKLDLDALAGSFGSGKSDEILAVDEAIARLGEMDPQQAQVVELRYFGGMTVEETAELLGISPRTVKRDWAMALAWLRAELSGRGSP
jgi:RNA polymerase sigma-70 factor (ECF subfamily)